MKQRTYIDGKRVKTSDGDRPLETVRRWMDNIEASWRTSGMYPLTPVGGFDFNKAHSVDRVSVDELVIVTTAGKTLRIINVPSNKKETV